MSHLPPFSYPSEVDWGHFLALESPLEFVICFWEALRVTLEVKLEVFIEARKPKRPKKRGEVWMNREGKLRSKLLRTFVTRAIISCELMTCFLRQYLIMSERRDRTYFSCQGVNVAGLQFIYHPVSVTMRYISVCCRTMYIVLRNYIQRAYSKYWFSKIDKSIRRYSMCTVLFGTGILLPSWVFCRDTVTSINVPDYVFSHNEAHLEPNWISAVSDAKPRCSGARQTLLCGPNCRNTNPFTIVHLELWIFDSRTNRSEKPPSSDRQMPK